MAHLRSLLIGTTAGLTALGAAAADLPVRKAVPVEYVRICTAYGAGYFYIPGTDTCIRVGGRARFEYTYQPTLNRNTANGDVSGYRTLGRLTLDSRTETSYGTLRAFVRLDVATRTGAYLTSGSRQRFADAFPALGPDTFGRLQKFVDVDKAFVQFAGFTAGRAASFYDFYAHDFELISATGNSDIQATNLLAYTATFGQGFTATISMEDPTFRRQPVFSNNGTSLSQTAFATFLNFNLNAPVIIAGGATPTILGFEDVAQKNRMPDFVGALRYDGDWGSAQVSAAVHEINGGSFTTITDAAGVTATGPGFGRAPNEYGWAVQGGVKINLSSIAPGDKLYLQGAYGEGAMSYTGYQNWTASEIGSASPFNGAQFAQYLNDAVLNPLTGRYDLSTSFTVTGAYLHYWAPEWRSAVFASYGEAHFSKNARFGLGLVGFGLPPLIGTGAAGLNAFNYSPALRDTNQIVAGASLIWSPVRDLDIGVEGVYVRTALNSGATNDLNKNPGLTAVNGVPIALARSSDVGQVRFRVQRDF